MLNLVYHYLMEKNITKWIEENIKDGIKNHHQVESNVLLRSDPKHGNQIKKLKLSRK